ncbi:S8 family serine peptidase [Paenarthrobacter sp. DKR-5]|uniref:S8 family serine peptidase n=1 Tax=Paenarthrobacter sp. DKR-5 TaxID=2835535 RepID=UPI001BDC9F09|nr:S8 family serine peptidase [Paenarthrobacter sp. DKR-5]MBT1002371.1 S8 family serine peptidase [Paenarthrobacter sp. DKR-5]
MTTSSWHNRALSGLLAAALLAGSVLLGLGTAPAAHADDIRDREYWLSSYGVTKAWTVSRGAGVKVAVIDSGIDASHQDLKGAVTGGYDVSGSGSANGTKGIGQTPEHGTLVATLLAGRGHAAGSDKPKPGTVGAGPDGVIGVAPEAQILSVSAWLGSPNPSGKSVDAQIPEAVRWAVDHGAKVINMSLGSSSTEWPTSWDDAFLYAEQKDVVIVAAAGNRGVGMTQVGAPATIPGVLTVAGLDRQGKASWDSSSQGISIGVAAPAEKLVGGLPGGRYADWSGTSGAAPLVSGVAALIRSKWPDMSAAQVINRIISTAKDAGAPGQDPIYGFGILNVEAALKAKVPVVTQNPLGSIAEWIRVHRRGSITATPTSKGQAPAAPAPTLPEPTVPVAAQPAGLDEAVPMTAVLGSGALLLAVLAGAAVHLARASRRLGGEEGRHGSHSAAAGQAKAGSKTGA